AKKSNIKPGRRALHRLRARGSEIAYGKAANTQVVKGNVGKLQRCAPSRCRLWVSLGPQPMFAARLLHPPAADMTRPPCDVAEVPMHKVAALQPAARGQEPRGGSQLRGRQ